MSRYVDVEKLISDGWHLEKAGESNALITRMSLADLPVADVVEVKHGKWHKFSENNYGVVDGYYCSECGTLFSFPSYVIDEDDEDVHLQDCLYCEHCGSKMDGERKEE